MNKTVELVNTWAEFETRYPKGSIEDFCRHVLARQRSKTVKGKFVGGVIPPFNDGLLLKIVGRITKLNMFYAQKALEGTEINQIEEFGVLATISQDGNPRKTDVIYSSLLDLSSGSDMLNRLKKRGLIREYRDDHDKRSRRVELTVKGKRVMELCYERITRNVRMLMSDLNDDDKELCVHVLKEVEIKFSALRANHKDMPFEKIYKEVMNMK